MAYRFAVTKESYEDYASGRVIRSVPGLTGFPVRLAREMFEQSYALLDAPGRCTVYDPCCGAGHLVTTLGLGYGGLIGALVASDVQPSSVALAADNLALVSREGMDARISALREMIGRYGNPAHEAALRSALALRAQRVTPAPEVRCFPADATDASAMRSGLQGSVPDVVVSDVPYERGSLWLDPDGGPLEGADALGGLLAALSTVTRAGAVVALATSRNQKAVHPLFQRRRQFKIGKRRITWLTRGCG